MIAFNSFGMEAFLETSATSRGGGLPMTVNKTIKSTLLILTIIAAALLPAQTLLGESNAKSPDYKELRLFREVMGIVPETLRQRRTG